MNLEPNALTREQREGKVEMAVETTYVWDQTALEINFHLADMVVPVLVSAIPVQQHP